VAHTRHTVVVVIVQLFSVYFLNGVDCQIAMPNDCYNTLNMCHLSPMQVQRMVQACASQRDSSGCTSHFSSLLSEIVPVPREYNAEDFWGTNREAYDVDCSAFTGGVSISFCTAWSPPSQEWIEALTAAMPKAHIELNYSSENDDFAGKTVAHDGVVVEKCTSISEVFDEWVLRSQPDDIRAILDDEEDELFQETDDHVREQWNDVECDELEKALDLLSPPFPSPHCQICVRKTMSLILNAAAACPILGCTRSIHRLQPPMKLGLTLSNSSLDLASLQPKCRGNSQRLRLMCCSRLLSILVWRLAGFTNRPEESSNIRSRATELIVRRCFSGLTWLLWGERKCENDGDDDDDEDDDDDGWETVDGDDDDDEIEGIGDGVVDN
jgi:hypothetical protein